MNQEDAEVHVIHRFWKANDTGRKVWCVQLRDDQLTVNLLREGEDGHRFEDMAAILTKWLPKWVDHFGVNNLHGTRIEYVNVISSSITPQFINKAGGIEIGKALVVFSGLPFPHAGLIPPYDCQMTVVADPKVPCTLTLRVFGSEHGRLPAIQIRFLAVTSTDKKSLTVPELSEEIALAHSKIIEAFEYLFTSEAKQSFEPS